MDFSASLPPQDILAYLLSQAPALTEADNLHCAQARSFLLAVGTYYDKSPLPPQPFGTPCPTCTVGHVLATLLHPDFKAVLHMLNTEPITAELTASFQAAARQQSLKQVAGVIAYTQVLLSTLYPGQLACERVAAYLTSSGF